MTEIQIKHQRRKSLSMRVTTAGDVIVFLPHGVRPENSDVQKFIQYGLEQLEPLIPAEKRPAQHDARSIRRMVKRWANRMGLKPVRIQMRTMYRKWGSCSSKGTVTLNTALYWLPEHLVEYVVVHELVHLEILDHSPAFWAKLADYMPDYETRLKELNAVKI